MDLSIIILSYKSKTDLERLLPSVFASIGIEFGVGKASGFSKDKMAASVPSGTEHDGQPYSAEIFVVDNDSGDGSYEWLTTNNYKLTALSNANNGFAKGNNLAIKQSTGKYVLLLNPDTKLEPNTLKEMLDLMESRPDIGISGCKLIKGDGKLDLACRRRFPNPWNSFLRLFLLNNKDYNYSNIPEDAEIEVDSVVGAFLLIRRSVIDKIGLLDEDYFMYGEDLDWCWRCKEAGYKVWYYPKAVCHHYKGQSSAKQPFRMLKVFHDAMWIFYHKHYATHYPFFFNWLIWLGIYGRMTALVVLNVFKKKRVVSK